jgi:hypothetical protein
MKKIVIGLFLFSTGSAFAQANNCQIYLTGTTTGRQISQLLDHGYQIVDHAEGATYTMSTTHEIIDSYLSDISIYSEKESPYEKFNVYRTKVSVFKKAQLIQYSDIQQEHGESHNNVDLVYRVQKKIIRKMGECSL